MVVKQQVASREKSTISLDAQFLERVRAVAVRRKLTYEEALIKYGGPGIEKEYRKVCNEQNEVGGEG